MTAAFRTPVTALHHPTRRVVARKRPSDTDHLRDLAQEVPIALVFDGSTAAVMMASPTDVQDFALGFALTEQAINDPAEVTDFEQVVHEQGIEARFWLRGERSAALANRRRVMAGPIGCGLCGIDSLAQATRAVPQVPESGLRLDLQEVIGATEALRAHQPLHDCTRAVHAAGFLLPGHGIIAAREDVGRHNALDKLVGALARQGVSPASGAFVMTSRISVELVQKAAIVGCSTLIAVSAPTGFAVDLADRSGITLAAFARGRDCEVFTHPGRIV